MGDTAALPVWLEPQRNPGKTLGRVPKYLRTPEREALLRAAFAGDVDTHAELAHALGVPRKLMIQWATALGLRLPGKGDGKRPTYPPAVQRRTPTEVRAAIAAAARGTLPVATAARPAAATGPVVPRAIRPPAPPTPPPPLLPPITCKECGTAQPAALFPMLGTGQRREVCPDCWRKQNRERVAAGSGKGWTTMEPEPADVEPDVLIDEPAIAAHPAADVGGNEMTGDVQDVRVVVLDARTDAKVRAIISGYVRGALSRELPRLIQELAPPLVRHATREAVREALRQQLAAGVAGALVEGDED